MTSGIEHELGRLEFELTRQVALRKRIEERHAHLRTRVRELLRRLPADLPAPASNMRLIVAALVSQTTEGMQREEDEAAFREGYVSRETTT